MTDTAKAKLLKEKELIERDLEQVAKKNPDNPSDWVPTAGSPDTSIADENTTADSFEELEYNEGITSKLENRLADVNNALAMIESGTYGKCKVCGMEIEADRLEANPAANTCKSHM